MAIIPTANGAMQNLKFSWNMCSLHTRLSTFGANLYAQSVLSHKISASELRVGSLLRERSLLVGILAYRLRRFFFLAGETGEDRPEPDCPSSAVSSTNCHAHLGLLSVSTTISTCYLWASKKELTPFFLLISWWSRPRIHLSFFSSSACLPACLSCLSIPPVCLRVVRPRIGHEANWRPLFFRPPPLPLRPPLPSRPTLARRERERERESEKDGGRRRRRRKVLKMDREQTARFSPSSSPSPSLL